MKAGAAVVLLVAGESSESHALEKVLSERGHGVVFVHDTESALRALDSSHPGGLVTELRSSRIDGMALLKRARALRPEVCAVLLAEDDRALDEAVKQGASDVQFPKVHVPRLVAVLERGFAFQAQIKRAETLEHRLDERLGFDNLTLSPELVRKARRAADSDQPYLLQGEAGSGKSVLAQAIHQNSARRHGPFVRASKVTALALKSARGGTLYLEEPAARAELASALEDKTVRVLASARADATGLAEEFREATIPTPPLRERHEDLPRLVDQFLKEFNRDYGRRVTGITRGAMGQLSTYDWPGNIRELKSTIEGMVVFAEARRPLDVSDLPHAVRNATRETQEILALPLTLTLAEVEKRFIAETLLSVRYDRPRAAATLGIGLRTLYRKLKEYEIG